LLGFILQACAPTVPPPQPEVTEGIFSRGVLHLEYQNTIFRTFEAARVTMQEQEITITSARLEADKGRLEGRLADGTAMSIDFRPLQPDLTRTSIKVGDYGSEEISREIGRGIDSRLREES
jgi:hypothetical protein